MMTAEQRQDAVDSRARAYDVGLRYGHLDAKAGLPEPTSQPEAIVGEQNADIWLRGWQEGHRLYMAPLVTRGTRVSIPSLVPGERIAASVTGRTQLIQGIVRIECYTPGGTAPMWIPVPQVQAKGV